MRELAEAFESFSNVLVAMALLLLSGGPNSSPRTLKVVVDAGHGAVGNVGNHGCHCQLEQDHTLAVAEALAAGLLATGRFEVKRARVGTAQPSYRERLAAAQRWKADAIISLHSDARGMAFPVDQGDGGVCWRNDDAPGFAVLWNDEGAALAGREQLGRAVGASLRDAGFHAYPGDDYGDLYRQDEVEPSGWIDQRPLRKRVYFLRGSTIPTVIIETHHALDPREVETWARPETLEAFTAAIAAALLDASTRRTDPVR